MRWKPASVELSELLEAAVGPYPCLKRQMFGCPAYFLNGNMFAGIHQDNMILRLSEPDKAELLGDPAGAVPFEPMPGRPMKEYVVVPDAIYGNPSRLEQWLTRSFQYVSSLPPKEAKSKSNTGGRKKK
ncbi:MAG: TfoX/Sxy family protein [Dehalococcoidia bacterium]|nr:TfoX/Sxy family protein [Dehalococcoidia bacterium]